LTVLEETFYDKETWREPNDIILFRGSEYVRRKSSMALGCWTLVIWIRPYCASGGGSCTPTHRPSGHHSSRLIDTERGYDLEEKSLSPDGYLSSGRVYLKLENFYTSTPCAC